MAYNYYVKKNINIPDLFFQKTKELGTRHMTSHDDDWHDEEDDYDHPYESHSKIKLKIYEVQTLKQKIFQKLIRIFK